MCRNNKQSITGLLKTAAPVLAAALMAAPLQAVECKHQHIEPAQLVVGWDQ